GAVRAWPMVARRRLRLQSPRFKPVHNLSFFKAEQIDDPRHAPTELYRRRMLGGTTSVWGGRCIPFDPRISRRHATDLDGLSHSRSFMDTFPMHSSFSMQGRPEFSATTALPNLPLPLECHNSNLALHRIERYSKPTDVWR